MRKADFLEKVNSSLFIISTQRSYIHQKLDTNSCFAKLRAISNLFSFFYTPCIAFVCTRNIFKDVVFGSGHLNCMVYILILETAFSGRIEYIYIDIV